MILQLSNRMTDLLLKKEIVSKEQREIYIYGFEALLSTVINTLLVFILGLLTGMIIETLVFLLSFAILRVYCGGYHAETHLGCISTFAGIYGFSMAAVKLIPVEYSGLVSVVLGGASLLFILAFAPIEHKNRPFQGNEYKNFRLMSIIVAFLDICIIAVIFIFFNQHANTALAISLAMLGVTFILALAKIIDKKR